MASIDINGYERCARWYQLAESNNKVPPSESFVAEQHLKSLLEPESPLVVKYDGLPGPGRGRRGRPGQHGRGRESGGRGRHGNGDGVDPAEPGPEPLKEPALDEGAEVGADADGELVAPEVEEPDEGAGESESDDGESTKSFP